MASDSPSPAWHPALRPNSAIALVNTTESDPASPATLTEGSSLKVSSEQSFDVIDKGEAVSENIDAWLAQDDGTENWLEDGPAGSPDDPAEAPTAEERGDSEADQHAASPPAPPADTIPQTMSTSNNMSLEDEEDAEWSLSRTESSDPFKFMPPTDRSNSFPAVPPIEPAEDSTPHILPANQARDVMEELEREAVLDDIEADAPVLGHDSLEDSVSPTARYEEGVPLIPHGGSSGQDLPSQGEGDMFSENAGEDEFFSRLHESGAVESPAVKSPPLDRKSTMQVLGATNVGSLSRATTMEDVVEEADDQDSANMPISKSSKEDNLGEDAVDKWKEAFGEDDPSLKFGNQETADGGDLAAKWSEAFGGEDDDFLLEDPTGSKEVDPSAFFGSDDEGFLEDTDEQPALPADAPTVPAQPAQQPTPSAQSPGFQNRYTPQNVPPSPLSQTSRPYAPPTLSFASQPTAPYAPPTNPLSHASPVVTPGIPSLPYGAPAPLPPPDVVRAQSFADKSKGGYSSPYDLPMEVVKPRKRASMQQLPRSSVGTEPPGPLPPPRSSSMQGAPQPPGPGGLSPPTSRDGPVSRLTHKPSAPVLRSKSSFFEELPVAPKLRPTTRVTGRGSPAQQPPAAPPQTSLPPFNAPMPQAAPTPAMTRSGSGGIPNLVAPDRVSPYAPLPTQQPTIPSAPQYAPAPAQVPPPTGTKPPAPVPVPVPVPSTRYSPATAISRPSPSSYPPTTASAPPAAILPHQPRTSSPLAHFEVSRDRMQSAPATVNGDVPQPDRRVSSTYEPRLSRIPSLPPTREEAEQDVMPPRHIHPVGMPPPMTAGHQESRYSPMPHGAARQTPPPVTAAPPQSALSPPKRTPPTYTTPPQAVSQPRERGFTPPPRAQTQSPSSGYSGIAGARPAEAVPRPSSVHSPTSPQATKTPPSANAPLHRARAPSQSFNLIAPTDGREHDPLQRWKGAPVITWGVGGTIVTSFPKDIPRYGASQSIPMVMRSPGEVKIKNVKDIQPLEDRVVKFPGPLKGKSKKKETIAWLSSGIDALEKEVAGVLYPAAPTHDNKRAVERLLLWKILRVFIEHDGSLEGTPAVEKAVRDVLAPELESQTTEAPGSEAVYSGPGDVAALPHSSATHMQADAVDASAIEQIRRHLLIGDREKAVWAAADKRLWGHAMLISNTVSPDLYKQVAQEFVRKEVNYPGHNNESIAALYKVLSGNHEECVDELVPVHARAGLQLVTTSPATGPTTKDALSGLDKWRETLGLILGNRSNDDIRALKALGELLSGYGRAEAAHICFLFARNASVFGGLDDPQSNIVLLGSDHRGDTEQFAKGTEALLLSEVFEYGLSLSGGSNLGSGVPHLAAYKLQLAMILAENGHRDKALQYCEVILNSITAQTKRSPYYHPILETTVDDFMKRLRQAPKEESSSWIPKPSMNKVSDTMWNRFNKFVAGDDNEGSAAGSPGEGGVESGPFARIAGGTPTISRPPSAAGFEAYGGNNAGYPTNGVTSSPGMAATRSASRYAPASAPSAAVAGPYEPASAHVPTPRSSMERTSSELTRNPYDASRSSTELSRSPYEPAATSPDLPRNPYEPARPSTEPAQPYNNNYNGYVANPNPLPSQLSQAPGYSTNQEASFGSQPQYKAPSYPLQNTDAASTIPPSYAPLGMQQPPRLVGESAMKPPASGMGRPGASDQQSEGFQPVSYGYEPPSMTSYGPQPAEPTEQVDQTTNSGTYEPPSYEPYGYEPPSYEPDPEQSAEDGTVGPEAKPKKKSFMDDDDDDVPGLRPQEKTKTDKDRENEEMVRKIAEEEAKRAAEQQAKKGWGFTNWWGGAKKDTAQQNPQQMPNKPVKANLGEQSSFVYDPDLKRWINKKAGADNTPAKVATPPPPKSTTPRSGMSTPPPSSAPTPPPPMSRPGRASAPPAGPPQIDLPKAPSQGSLESPPAMVRSASNTSATGPPSGPPSRPPTSMSNASSIDDLLGAPGPRKPGQKKAKKGGRYVDVMAK